MHFDFNAWGGLYSDTASDKCVPAAVLDLAGAPRYVAPLVLEGGSVHVDGEGTLLTTEECLLAPNRNPGLNRMQIEDHLQQYLGVKVCTQPAADASQGGAPSPPVCLP